MRTAGDLSLAMQVSVRTIYSLVDQGFLPCHRIGKRLLRFTPGDWQVFVERSGSENR